MKYLLTILAIFTGELFLKNHIEANMPEDGEKKALGGAVILTKHHNRGAALNTGERHPGIIKAISVAVTFAAAVLFLRSLRRAGQRTAKWGLSLILGGGLSNTCDRFKRGYVVDYFRLNVPVKKVNRLIFNVSDFCIALGAMQVVLSEMRAGK